MKMLKESRKKFYENSEKTGVKFGGNSGMIWNVCGSFKKN